MKHTVYKNYLSDYERYVSVGVKEVSLIFNLWAAGMREQGQSEFMKN